MLILGRWHLIHVCQAAIFFRKGRIDHDVSGSVELFLWQQGCRRKWHTPGRDALLLIGGAAYLRFRLYSRRCRGRDDTKSGVMRGTQLRILLQKIGRQVLVIINGAVRILPQIFVQVLSHRRRVPRNLPLQPLVPQRNAHHIRVRGAIKCEAIDSNGLWRWSADVG